MAKNYTPIAKKKETTGTGHGGFIKITRAQSHRAEYRIFENPRVKRSFYGWAKNSGLENQRGGPVYNHYFPRIAQTGFRAFIIAIRPRLRDKS